MLLEFWFSLYLILMAFDRAKLIRAIETLEKYYGISGADDLLRVIALESVVANPQQQASGQRPFNEPNQVEAEILNTFFLDKTALFSTKAALDIVGTQLSGATNPDVLAKFNRTFQIFHERDTQIGAANSFIDVSTNRFQGTVYPYGSIREVLAVPQNEGSINKGDPTKITPGVSLYLCNSHRLNFNQFYGNLLTIWMNGIPTEELAKSTPFFNIEFNTPRAAIDAQGGLSAMGLNKYIFGAKSTNGASDPFFITSKANESSILIQGQTSTSTIAGMEIFTSPIGLVPDRLLTQAEHSNRILDPMQPFLSIEDLTINVAPSNGIMSFKTATLTLKLHDRSRMADIAELIRPEYYGLNEIMIEYGWIHPDAEFRGNPEGNPYADMINNVRVKEKYGIINSSYNFSDSGVKISLQLCMRGASDFSTETIASSDENLQNIMSELQIVRSALETIRNRFPGGRVMGREIRGFDVINNLSDSTYNFTLGKEFLDQLRDLQTSIARVPQLSDLNTTINRIVQQTRANGATGTRVTGGIVRRAQTTILQDIQAKIANLMSADSADPMLLQVNDSLEVVAADREFRQLSGTYAQLPTGNTATARDFNQALGAIGISNINDLPSGQFSLAKLLLEFVAKPLTAVRKYDDIQLFFYPFNVYAGKANRLNIGNFGVDARLFIMRYMEWRLGRLNQSLNVNLTEFLRFIVDQIMSETSARSYGLYEPEGGTRTVNQGFRYFVENGQAQIRFETPGAGRRGAAQEADGGAYLQQLTRVLEGVTPNAEFRPPQIEFHIEALPMKVHENNEVRTIDSKTVLRIHIFDRAATSLESLSQLEMASRDLSLQSIGTAWTQAQSSVRNIGATDPNAANQTPRTQATIPTADDVNEVVESAKRNMLRVIELAVSSGLIQATQSSEGAEATPVYRVTGGPEELREFFRKNSPHLLYGASGTTVRSPSFSSLMSSELSTIMMIRSTTRAELQSNGENPGGLPMQVAPGECEIPMLGNPLIPYLQSIFCDFQTGTTIDNFYAVTGITHTLGPGKFDTKLKLTPVDGYGKYINVVNVIQNYTNELQALATDTNDQLDVLRATTR